MKETRNCDMDMSRDRKNSNVQATANEQTIRNIVQEVLTQLTTRNGSAAKVNGSTGPDNRWGVFDTVDEAVEAAQKGFEKLSRASLEQRRTAIDIVKRICDEQANELADLADQNDLRLMVGHLLEYHPGVLRVKQMISDGELGDVLYILYANHS